jgi:transposase
MLLRSEELWHVNLTIEWLWKRPLDYLKRFIQQCKCGFKTHRDILGARNIINAPVVDGKSLSA